MPRSERLYLIDIVEAAEAIDQFIAGHSQDDFVRNDLVRSAVLFKLAVVGEAASHLGDEFRNRHADVDWRRIVAFRNIAIHAYFAVNWSIVWDTATKNAPTLAKTVQTILSDLDDDETV